MPGLLAALLASGCATTSTPPALPLAPPATWAETAARDARPPAADWWRDFGSAELAALTDAAFADSPDLAAAAERVRQAEAQVRVAGASLFPALDLRADAGRRRSAPSGAPALTSDSSGLSLGASYELDLWGRNRAGLDARQAGLRASGHDLEAARLSLVAGVATAYFQTLSLRERLAIAGENLAIARRVLALVTARVENGAASPLDRERQRAAVLGQEAGLLALQTQERQTLYGLATLVGRPPAGFGLAAADLRGLAVPEVAPGLPAELLARRPDLAGAEARLAAAGADVAVARAALLPSVSLTAAAGAASGALLSLAGGTGTLAVSAGLLQPVFNAGRLRAQADAARARERELLELYRAAALAAFNDVESALAATGRAGRQEALQAEARDAAARALRLAELRYREGADNLLSVLDAQRTLFQAQDQLAQLRLTRLRSAIDLFKALGGGWRAQTARVTP